MIRRPLFVFVVAGLLVSATVTWAVGVVPVHALVADARPVAKPLSPVTTPGPTISPTATPSDLVTSPREVVPSPPVAELSPTPSTATPSASAVVLLPSVAPSEGAPGTGAPSPAPPRHALAPGPGAPLVYAGNRNQRVIALTIDDGFSSDAVLADLALLEREHVNATWFPIGRVVADHPAVWRQVAAAGYPIANHTYDHSILTGLSYPAMVADITRDQQVVESVTGVPLLPVVRPPGGVSDDAVRQAAAAAGERALVLWDTVDDDTVGDWTNVAHLVAAGEEGRNGSILLVHANHEFTTAALPAIIAFYRSHGFRFVTIGQLLGIAGPVPFDVGPVDASPPS